jgi:hypothetical protein
MTLHDVRPDVRAALARADEMEAEGRHLEAIDLLTAANAGEGDVAIEQRLVQLRCSAFADLDHPVGRDVWPPELDDPFPDVSGRAPEITLAELTPAVLGGALMHHGSLLIRGLVSGERAEELGEIIRQAYASRHEQSRMKPERRAAPDRWYTPFAPGRERADMFGKPNVVRVVDSPRAMFELVETYRSTGLTAAITEYLGERPALSANKWGLRRVPADAMAGDHHQDGAFLGEGIRTVNIWLPLTRCGGDAPAPGLDFYPCRLDHIIETGGDDAFFDWTVPPSRGDRECAPFGVMRPEFAPGDALLFDEMLLHRTAGGGDMTMPRLAVESWFFASSQYPGHHIAVII